VTKGGKKPNYWIFAINHERRQQKMVLGSVWWVVGERTMHEKVEGGRWKKGRPLAAERDTRKKTKKRKRDENREDLS